MPHLKDLRIEFDTEGGLPHAERLSSGKQGEAELAYIQSISGVVDRLKLLWIYFAYVIGDEKILMHKPVTEAVWLTLSRCPNESVVRRKNTLHIGLKYDPADLLKLSQTSEGLGEFALTCWEAVLPRLETETDFPVKLMRTKIAQFRADNYTLTNTLKPVSIAGSKAKARIHGEVGCAQTRLMVEVSYRKKPLFERVIWETADQAFNIAYEKRDCVVEDGQFKVRVALPVMVKFLLPEAAFALDELPDAFLETRT